MIKIYTNNIIYALKITADRNFQKSALENPNGPYIWIPIENYNDIFEDSAILTAWKNNQIVFRLQADNLLRILKFEMDKINYQQSPQVIFGLPQMQIVRQKAAGALALIQQEATYIPE